MHTLPFYHATILQPLELDEEQWHQLDHMQIICTSLKTDNHASTSPLSFFTGGMPFLPPNQQCQSTEGNWNKWKRKIKGTTG